MSKVLRLHNGTAATGGDNINGWGHSTLINDKAIESIIDPQGDDARFEITSIPSPFARMDLVMQAFKFVNDRIDAAKTREEVVAAFNGVTIHHKMVSDMLDVAELFFNIDKYTTPPNQIIELGHWSVSAIKSLKEDKEDQMKRLFGDTLDLFIKTDQSNGNVYQLKNLNEMFFLKYVGDDAPSKAALPGHIIGATSPSTLFFTPAGDLSYVAKKVLFEGNNDRPFDGNYNPLYKRATDFIQYLVALRNYEGFSGDFKYVADYIDKTCTFMGNALEIKPLEGLPITNIVLDNGMQVKVADKYPIMKKKQSAAGIADNSQFVIQPNSKKHVAKLPLVLPIDHSCAGWTYTNSEWNPEIMVGTVPVDFSNSTSPEERLLPGINVKYPFLTISDFLEENLISTDFSNASFLDKDGEKLKHNPNYYSLGDKDGLDKYLIPIKKCFFDYFSIDDLKRYINASRRTDGSVRVELKIPVKGDGTMHDVTFTRDYLNVLEDAIINNPNRSGKIISVRSTGVTILPHMKFCGDAKPNYRVTLYIDRDITDNNGGEDWPELSLIDVSGKAADVGVGSPVCRNYDTGNGSKIDTYTDISKTYSVDRSFDIVQVSYKGNKNLVIPVFRLMSGGSNVFSFAVDFGTTNTHIEYAVDGKAANTFDFFGEDAQLCPNYGLSKDPDWRKVMDGDLIPREVGAGKDVSFPIRTALTCKRRTNWGETVTPLLDSNIPFYYEKKIQPKYNEAPLTNLKWEPNNNVAENRRKNFIENLAILMRNKVLMNDGDLSKTKIVWFYPTSMKPSVVGELSQIWQKVYADYFGGNSNNNVTSVPEAVAPVFYYTEATTDAITIDIGGGTSDFSFAKGKNVEYISSARFASNSLFGDGLCGVNMSNGIVNHFMEEIKSRLDKQENLKDIMEDIKQGANASSNLVSFFFSLKDNTEIGDVALRENLDFTKMLSGSSESCAVLLVFYMALIYYVANVVKEKGMKEPRFIGFSGNGSKVLNIFFKNRASKPCIVEITQAIFEKVLGRKYDKDGISILETKDNSPKQATAKGGIAILQNGDMNKFDPAFAKKHTVIWTGAVNEHAISENRKLKYGDLSKDTDYVDIVKSVKEFVEVCKSVIKDTSAQDYINLPDNIDQFFAADAFTRDLGKHINDGIMREQVRDEDDVNTPLFFYPIEGILYNLANENFAK